MDKQLKILVVRFSSIGDIVLTTPVVRCLQQQLDAEVHYLTKKGFASILKTNPYLTKVWAIQSTVSEIKNELKNQQFDYIIDLHKNLRTLHLRFLLQSKFLSFQKLNFEKWLMTKFKINRLPKIHIVDRYLATTRSLGIQNDYQGLDYFIPKQDEVNIQSFKQHSRNKIIAFAIGAAHATKRLPTEKIITICQQIVQQSNYIIILLGGKEDIERSKIIERKAKKNLINLCGQLNLNQSASIIRQANLIITHDTGLMHIAAAFQQQIISVWGNTIPAFGMYPYVAKSQFDIVENKALSCRPCSKIGHQNCPKGHFNCMNMIDEQEIIHLLNQKEPQKISTRPRGTNKT